MNKLPDHLPRRYIIEAIHLWDAGETHQFQPARLYEIEYHGRRNLSVVVHRRHFHIRIVHQINARAGLQIIMYGMFPDLCPDSFQYVIDRRTISYSSG